MSLYDYSARSAAETAWKATGQAEPWHRLPEGRRNALIAFAGGVLDASGRTVFQPLNMALHTHYENAPGHSMLTQRFTSGDHVHHPLAMAIMQTANSDGTNTEHLLQASYVRDVRGRLTAEIQVETLTTWLTWHEEFWQQIVASRGSQGVVMNAEHWTVHEDEGPLGMRGYGGREWTIFYLDNRDNPILHTRNLWHQGKIPPAFREALPDNAILIDGHHETLTDSMREAATA